MTRAILGIPAMDTVKEVKRASLPTDVALITATIPRERVVLAQTPQVFRASAAAGGVCARCGRMEYRLRTKRASSSDWGATSTSSSDPNAI